MKISVSIKGLDALKASLGNQAKQINFAASKALNATAKKVAEAMPAEIDRAIDKPTPFTRSGVRVLKYANKANLSATVGFMDKQARYMQYQTDGGERRPGARGIKLPGNIVLNTFGNIPRGVIDKLKAAAEDYSLGTTVARRLQTHGNRRKGAAPIELFLGKPRGPAWDDAPYGIWRRIPGSPGKLVPVVLFSDKPVRYRRRFDFAGKAGAVVAKEWSVQFNAALADALRTAR